MLKLKIKKPRKFISPLLSKKSIVFEELTSFHKATDTYLKELETQRFSKQSEPNIVSNALKPYFEALGYNAQSYSQNGQSGMDLALMFSHSPAVIIEAKVFDSSAMVTSDDINKKALHEAILYFMRERHRGNNTIYHVIITDFYRWFVFDAKDFEKIFWKNSRIKKIFESVKDPSVLGSRTEDFYDMVSQEIAEMKENLIDDKVIECAYFDLRDKQNKKESIALYKLLSKDTLLKAFNPNDANTLNKDFYNELLYLLGLEEKKSSGKKLIMRAKVQHRGALYENIVQKLSDYGKSTDFESVIRLMIIWINRILFLKLLESQLIKWNDSNEYAFLNKEKIRDFDQLEMLFFDILAKKTHERGHREFDYVPYLNSSLFEPHEFEQKLLTIATLQDDCNIPYYKKTVLKDAYGKRKEGEVNMLHYLFAFLDAYDFSSEGSEELVSESKSLINASVLGLIFEKLNGYKDGSFYTPSFITMYMSKETITKAIIEKFNQIKGWECKSLNELDDRIEDKKEANSIIDSLTICDPAVGSGHFLVSVLNTILEIKSQLRILFDAEGKRIKDYELSVENDELIIRDDEGEIFEYKRHSREKTRIQKMLFSEKQKIIENSLFGVDINPNSAQITRLRLWIELLKNSYYAENTLVTMPNIDINIKVGNSLISRYGIDDEIDIPNIKHAIEEYKRVVVQYKEGDFLTSKNEIRKAIEDVKEMFGLTLKAQWKQTEKFEKVLKEYVVNFGLDGLPKSTQLEGLKYLQVRQTSMFGEDEILSKAKEKQRQTLLSEITKAALAIEEIEKGKIYEDAFEWRFEFPEVLDEEGNFVGFDVVIGNPPYLPLEYYIDEEKKFFANKYVNLERKYESSVMFIEEGFSLLKTNGILSYIAPMTFQTGSNYTNFRKNIVLNYGVQEIINLPFNVFEDAYVDTAIYILRKKKLNKYKIFNFDKKFHIKKLYNIKFHKINTDAIDKDNYKFIQNEDIYKIQQKISKSKIIKLGEISISTQGLSGSNFSSDTKGDLYPYLSIGNVYNYKLEIIKTYYTDMKKHERLKKFYRKDEKILIRRIINRQDRLTIGYTSKKMVFKKDINPFLITNQAFQTKYILAVLASKFISWIYVNISSIALKDDFRQTTLTELRSLPIPIISTDSQKNFIKIVNKILENKILDKDTSDLEAQIDRMVYELYGLSEEEIAVVEGREAENVEDETEYNTLMENAV